MAYLTEVFADLPSGTVSSGGTTAPSAGTSESWTVSVSAAFAALHSGSQHFYAADKNLPGEVFEVTACPGGTGSQSWTVTRGADGTATAAHGSGFTVVQVASAATLAALSRKPWQFRPEDYGAKHDAVTGTGGTGTSGTATFTDTGASFTSADAGKVIVINQGTSGAGTQFGTNQNPFCGTISAVNSATSVTLSGNLAATCTSAPYIYGSDDQSAVQACVNAAGTWAQANGQMAEVLFGPFIYMLAALTQATGSAPYNSHLAIPYGTQAGQRTVIRLKGTGIPGIDYWNTTAPQLSGTCLVSGIFPGTQPDVTYGQVSVIGSQTAAPAASSFVNTALSVDDITIVLPWNSQMYGVDGRFIDHLTVPHGLCKAFAPVNVPLASVGGPYLQRIPVNTVAAGYAFPVVQNNTVLNAHWLSVEGVANGISISEHAHVTKLSTLYCNIGMNVTQVSGTKHGITIGHFTAEGCNTVLDASATTSGSVALSIGLMDGETNNTAHVNDPNNALCGTIGWNEETSSNVVVIGGAGLIVTDFNKHRPGPWSGAPAAPASNTAQQNLSYRYVTLYISATTSITSVAIGATTGSMTSVTVTAGANVAVPVRVLPGWYWKATYSGTLTASWWLD